MDSTPGRVEILGVGVDILRREELTRAVSRFVDENAHALVLNVNLHALNLAYENPWFRDVLNRAAIVFADGEGVVLAAKVLGDRLPERITYGDWIWDLAEAAQANGHSFYFLGAKPGVAQEAAERLRLRYPGLRIVGIQDGYFDKRRTSEENARTVASIRAAKPDILLVGFGMPLQERWLTENWNELDARVGLSVGGMFDLVAGRRRPAPRWMQDHGLEWLGRLVIEPRRLWRRYLIGNPEFAVRLLREKWRRRREKRRPLGSAQPEAETRQDSYPRVNVLGVGIDAVGMPKVLAMIKGWIDSNHHRYVCLAAVHSVMDCLGRPELRSIFNRSGLTTPDGMALVWIARLRGHREVERVYGPDLLLAACDHFRPAGCRHYFYGGEAEVAAALATALRERFPWIVIAGTSAPPFRQLDRAEDAAAVRLINDAAPDIVWVGLGSPKQEEWMAAHVGKINAPVMIGVGAAFDFLSGRKPQAPRWMQRAGLEWLFRLLTEPRRLWRRYAEYPLFIVLAAAQILGIKRFPLDSGPPPDE